MKICSVRGLASQCRLVLGLLSLMICSLAAAAGAGWYNNFEQAVQAARQQGRPIFVDFSTSWCSVCKQMDRTTLADPAVLARLDNFIKVKVDGDAFPQLCQAYGVEAYPTFVHLDPSGRVLERREGGMRVQEMAGALDKTLRSVSTSMAIAQAKRAEAQRKSDEAAAQSKKAEIASADLSNSQNRETEQNTRVISREARYEASRTESRSNPSQPVLYNMSDRQLQGSSVYANEPSESSSRRSRFASAGDSGLKELAEATANPNDAISEATSSESESKNFSKDAEKSEESKSAQTDDIKPALASNEKSDSAKQSESAKPTAAVATSAKALAQSARETSIPPAAPSPVIETRLASLSTESLPRPILNRTASASTQALAPAATSKTTGAPAKVSMASDDTAAGVRTVQRNDAGDAVPSIPKKSVEIAAAKSPKIRESERVAKSDGEHKSDTKKNDDKAEKTSQGATEDDIIRWMKDADAKLVESHKTGSVQRKREARALYNKVVEMDPKNQFGRSDMAFIKMVSLIVDRDSDLLRRQAYTRIKEFEDRFPKSDHKDYYTLIRAILAADLGENSEVRKLLADYSERFPDSKYAEMARDTLKSLSGSKKESGRSSADSSQKSKRRNG